MKDFSSDLFVTPFHIQLLLDKSLSTCRNELRNIRIYFGVKKPQRVTRDQVCIYYTITLEQYIRRLREASA